MAAGWLRSGDPGGVVGVVSAVVYVPRVSRYGTVALSPAYGWPGESGDARFSLCFGTGTGPSGWKVDTNGVLFY